MQDHMDGKAGCPKDPRKKMSDGWDLSSGW
jgi:hypothetical protein